MDRRVAASARPRGRLPVVTRYRLDARRFAGPLCAPTRNDRETVESDDRAELQRTATALVARGFTVWIYERVPRAGTPPTYDGRPNPVHDLRLVDQRAPTAR